MGPAVCPRIHGTKWAMHKGNGELLCRCCKPLPYCCTVFRIVGAAGRGEGPVEEGGRGNTGTTVEMARQKEEREVGAFGGQRGSHSGGN